MKLRRLQTAALGLAVAIAPAGCFDAPTPLAPTLRGSVGITHHGVLEGGARLPQRGPGYRRMRVDGVRYGHPRLVALLEDAAAAVARERPNGPRLVIADLSNRHGGKAERHSSHRTGRDVDILFYTLTPDGRPERSRGFLPFGADGIGVVRKKGVTHFQRLDLERNWLLVKALLASRHAEVQWLFVARWVEAQIIEYARARGEPDWLVARASKVMHQPGDSFPHHDHFHMRIACAPGEKVMGCRGGGLHWPWFAGLPAAVELSDAALVGALLEGVPDAEGS